MNYQNSYRPFLVLSTHSDPLCKKLVSDWHKNAQHRFCIKLKLILLIVHSDSDMGLQQSHPEKKSCLSKRGGGEGPNPNPKVLGLIFCPG